MIKITFNILTTLLLYCNEVYSAPKVEPTTDSGDPTIQFTCSAKLAPGEMLAWWQTKLTWTDRDLRYRKFFPLVNDTVHFKVRAANDAYFGFLSAPRLVAPWIDVVLGGWAKTKNSITLNRFHQIYADVDHIVNDCEFRGFWARKDGDLVSAGFEGETSPFITWKSTVKFTASHFSVASGGGSTGHWKIEGYSWMGDDDILLDMIQNPSEELLNPMELVLNRTRRSIDNDTTVYCAKHRMLADGKLSRGAESRWTNLAIQTEVIPSEELYVKVGPETRIEFDVNSSQKFTCSGSAPVDGRILRWFRKDRSYRDPISLENQNYDPITNTNDLELSLDESYDLNQLFCAQGYQYSIQHNGTTIIKNYGDIVKSEDITLIMKRENVRIPIEDNRNVTVPECSVGQRVSMWPGMVVVAVISTFLT
ncbi:uncharacterized protein LOC133532117 [Cydia pomonella]|uniref:uncharacterized protein LOC133532117 n=1 Tax=Cydia pomonella TaxID=82600 RepID=UPI002ADD8D37|nr:uncharacterized protein LOC133532117 [Cydia pomonella]